MTLASSALILLGNSRGRDERVVRMPMGTAGTFLLETAQSVAVCYWKSHK